MRVGISNDSIASLALNSELNVRFFVNPFFDSF